MNNPRLFHKQGEEKYKLKGEFKVACFHWKILEISNSLKTNWNMTFYLNAILRRLHYVCLLASSFQDGRHNNHSVGNLVMKPVDDMS